MRNFTCVLTSRLFNLQLVTFLTSKVSALHIKVRLRINAVFFFCRDKRYARAKFQMFAREKLVKLFKCSLNTFFPAITRVKMKFYYVKIFQPSKEKGW